MTLSGPDVGAAAGQEVPSEVTPRSSPFVGLRVALVSSSYHPYFGGVEEHTGQVAHQLNDRGIAVEVWTVDRGESLGEQVVDGVRVRYLPTPLPARDLRSLLAFSFRFPGSLSAWAKAVRAFRPTVLNVQCFGPNGIYGLFLAWMFRVPLVVSSHGETFGDAHDAFGRSRLLRASLQEACRRSAQVTACSDYVAADLKQRFGASDIRVVPNAVVRHVREAREQLVLPPRTVLAAGRLVQNKGFDLLMRAVAETASSPHLVLVGDGEERESLGWLARDLGIEDRVMFAGRKSSEEVRSLMSQATVVVVPSRVEAFGIVVLEAWASGTPLIATTHGGPADLLSDGVNGLLVDPEHVDRLASAIDGLLEDPGLRAHLAAGGLDAVEAYTWPRVLDDYLEVYRHAQAGPSGPAQLGDGAAIPRP